ncbi:MAG: hypothetical protein HUK14_01645 [Muribaculaceae bacterium]|nr:hypothetical protein [Muribaculaceae bacterium]
MKTLNLLIAAILAGSPALFAQTEGPISTNRCGDKFQRYSNSFEVEGKFLDFDNSRPVSEYNPLTIVLPVSYEIDYPISSDLKPLKEYIIKEIIKADDTLNMDVAASQGAKKVVENDYYYPDEPHYYLSVTQWACGAKWVAMLITEESKRGDVPVEVVQSRGLLYDRQLQKIVPSLEIISDFHDKGLVALVNKAIDEEYKECGFEGIYSPVVIDSLNNEISVEKDGITFWFNRYEIPWSDGESSYTIPYADIKPYLTPYFIKLMGL